MLGFACIVFYDGLFRKADFLSDIIGLICGCNAPFYIVNAAAPLWYLSMFFILKCVYSLVEEVSLLLTSKRVFNISRPEFWQTGIILLLSIIGKSLVSHRQMYSYVWNVDIAFLFLPFMWFGNCISYFFGRGREKIFIIGVSRILIRIKWMEKIFSTIGENSLILLPIHYPLANLFLEYKSKYGFPIYIQYIVAIGIVAISLIVAFGVKNKFSFLVGMQKKNEQELG